LSFRRELDEAQKHFDALSFVWQDHAPTHQDRLRAYAAKLREMWRRK